MTKVLFGFLASSAPAAAAAATNSKFTLLLTAVLLLSSCFFVSSAWKTEIDKERNFLLPSEQQPQLFSEELKSQTRIENAYAMMENLFETVPVPAELKSILPKDVEVIHGAAPKLFKANPDLLQPCLILCRTNMKDIYEKSNFQMEGTPGPGWYDEPKIKELSSDLAHLVIIRESPPLKLAAAQIEKSAAPAAPGEETDSTPVIGLAHIRFLQLDPSNKDSPVVLYLYEIQLAQSLRGKGVGANLMKFVKEVAVKTRTDGVRLTVQDANTRAYKFYTTKCGFKESSKYPGCSELEWFKEFDEGDNNNNNCTLKTTTTAAENDDEEESNKRQKTKLEKTNKRQRA